MEARLVPAAWASEEALRVLRAGGSATVKGTERNIFTTPLYTHPAPPTEHQETQRRKIIEAALNRAYNAGWKGLKEKPYLYPGTAAEAAALLRSLGALEGKP